jgi:predicted RNase H-like nuclease (RuvC/YqgF family)
LLQSKISEIENSEIKTFEESFMLKGWVRQLELENLKYQDMINSLTNGRDADPASNPKLKALQDEVLRLINALEERDKRCEQLTLEITRVNTIFIFPYSTGHYKLQCLLVWCTMDPFFIFTFTLTAT